MTENKGLIALGFNVFLEHQLSYGERSEKGEVSEAPRVHLGGGAFNFAKTLHTLGVPANRLLLETLSSEKPTAQSIALDFLLKKEVFKNSPIPILARPYSSYYLTGSSEKMFAFGDRKMSMSKPPLAVIKSLEKVAKRASIKIATEVLADPISLSLATVFLKRTKSQQSVLVPSRILLSTKKVKQLFPCISMLALNKDEAVLYWGSMFGEKEILNCPVATIFVTDGSGEAMLKVDNIIYRALPDRNSNPKYPGGAGDTATATLVYELFIRGSKPEVALKKALKAGTRVLSKPTSHL